MKKIAIILGVVFMATIGKAQTQYWDTSGVHITGGKKVNSSIICFTVVWNVVDTNTNYLTRLPIPETQDKFTYSKSFNITYYNVEGQNILYATFDSAFVYTRNNPPVRY